eukprot:429511_1
MNYKHNIEMIEQKAMNANAFPKEVELITMTPNQTEDEAFYDNMKTKKESSTDFKQWRESDYIACKDDVHHIEQCNVIKRIVNILDYYQRQKVQVPHRESSKSVIYEYISVFKNYNISRFMEDWYHIKTNHLKDEKTINRMVELFDFGCDKTNECSYIRRYERERSNDAYITNEKMDVKEFILMDQLDSIHAFIFHSKLGRMQNVSGNSIEDRDNDEYDFKEEEKLSQKSTQLIKEIKDFNHQQMMNLLNTILNETHNTKLINNKQSFLSYFKEYKTDGNTFTEMQRK